MFQDEIVKEIHKIREDYSRSFNHDLKAMFADLQKQQLESEREFVNLSRKPSLTMRWHRRAEDIGGDAEDRRRST